jgi:hypothetical protein
VTGLTAYASAYQRDRVCEVRLYASEKRPLVANFVGILGATPAIASALWETLDTSIVAMSDAAVSGNTTSINVAAGYPGTAGIRCTITLDNGARYVQLFAVRVLGGPQFAGDVFTAGTSSLTATGTTGGDGVLDGGGA